MTADPQGHPRRGRPPKHLGRDTRAELLRAGMLAFAERGVVGASTRQIAAQVGVQAGTLYAYFGNKAGLLGEALGRMGPGAVVQASAQLHAPADLPAFVGQVWAAWTTPTARAAFALYLIRTGHALPAPGGQVGDLETHLRAEVLRAHAAVSRQIARWPGLPAPAAEVAWLLTAPLLHLRAADLHQPGQEDAAQAHTEAIQRWVQGGARPHVGAGQRTPL